MGPSGTNPNAVRIEADGGSRGNPGPAGYGAVLKVADNEEVIAEAAASIGHATNNVAEYNGLIAGLGLYREHTPDAKLEVRLDSKLVVEQMAGRWKVKHPDIRPLALKARSMAPPDTVWTWVPREQNAHADRLANLAMDAAARGEVYEVSGRTGEADADGDARTEDDDRRQDASGRHEATPTAYEPPGQGVAERSKNPMLGWSGLLGQPTTLIFVRHGFTLHTVDRRFSGPGGDDPGLIDEGREQARRAAEALRGEPDVAALLASPMRRAQETAEILSAEIGQPVQVEDGFRECAFGDWDGLTLSDVEERWPDDLDEWLHSMEFVPPGGESIAQVQVRVEEALVKTLAAYPGRTVVVVSHVNPIKLAVRYALGAPLESINRMQLSAGSLTTLSFYESGASSLRVFSALP